MAQSVSYADSKAWYQGFPGDGSGTGAAKSVDKSVDVLFFPPTSVSDRDGEGRNMNPVNAAQRRSMDVWFATAKAIFGDSCNFYGPYYRQVTMESFGKPYFEQVYQTALDDALLAFDYYMKNLNHGRPFILAGHSQGAKIVFSLIKARINDSNYPLLVAAYPIGYRISQRELDQCKFIRGAQSAVDVGVCVSYHSAASASCAMFPNNAIVINPMNWRTDGVKASSELNLGSRFYDADGNVVKQFDSQISAYLDSATGALIVSGVKPADYHKSYLGGYPFRSGNYHLQDLSFFVGNLQQNVKDRIASYFFKNKR